MIDLKPCDDYQQKVENQNKFDKIIIELKNISNYYKEMFENCAKHINIIGIPYDNFHKLMNMNNLLSNSKSCYSFHINQNKIAMCSFERFLR